MFANGAASAAFSYAAMWAVKTYGAGGTINHDRNTDGELGPDRFTEEQKAALSKQLKTALATQPKEGFASDIEALKWFKKNIYSIANQNDIPLKDFEVSAILAPMMNGKFKFLGVRSDFYYHLVYGGNLHTHQTSNFFSQQDGGINETQSNRRYLVNDNDFYMFDGAAYKQDINSWQKSNAGPMPNSRSYYYKNDGNEWANYKVTQW